MQTKALLYVQNVTDKKFLNALGQRVRELRLAKNLTQEDLGFLVGNSGKQIGRIERGENNVTPACSTPYQKHLNYL